MRLSFAHCPFDVLVLVLVLVMLFLFLFSVAVCVLPSRTVAVRLPILPSCAALAVSSVDAQRKRAGPITSYNCSEVDDGGRSSARVR